MGMIIANTSPIANRPIIFFLIFLPHEGEARRTTKELFSFSYTKAKKIYLFLIVCLIILCFIIFSVKGCVQNKEEKTKKEREKTSDPVEHLCFAINHTRKKESDRLSLSLAMQEPWSLLDHLFMYSQEKRLFFE